VTYAEIRDELATASGSRRAAVREEALRRTLLTGYRWPAELLAF
jgi:hypothetical protein